MTRPLPEALAGLLAEWGPASLLVIGDALPGQACAGARVTQAAPRDLDALGRFDAAVLVADAGLDGEVLERLLGRLKNVHAPKVAAVLEHADPARMRALAFSPAGNTLWVHDIDRYNPRREWNSADDWAHPENFDKYRW